MLKPLVGALVVANLAFWVWTHFVSDGPAGDGEREPARLAAQVDPERIRVLGPARGSTASSSGNVTPAEPARPAASAALAADPSAPAAPTTPAAAPPTAAAAAPACLQAGPFGSEDLSAAAAAVRAAVPSLGSDQLAMPQTERPGVWIVYMGRYASNDALQRKQDELRRRQIAYDPMTDGPGELTPGLALGRYERRPDAEAALAKLELRGIRTARVVTLATPGVEHRLRVEQADAALQAKLTALTEPALKGRSFVPCPAAAPAAAASSPAAGASTPAG